MLILTNSYIPVGWKFGTEKEFLQVSNNTQINFIAAYYVPRYSVIWLPINVKETVPTLAYVYLPVRSVF